jgi:hypothetical protein
MIHTEPHPTYDANDYRFRLHTLFCALITFHCPYLQLLYEVFRKKSIKGFSKKQLQSPQGAGGKRHLPWMYDPPYYRHSLSLRIRGGDIPPLNVILGRAV